MTRANTRTEKQVQQDIIRNLRAMGFDVDDLTQPRATMMPLGLPDLRVRTDRWGGILAWVEVKAENGRLSVHQKAWHERERAAGGTVIVAKSTDDVLDGLRALGAPLT